MIKKIMCFLGFHHWIYITEKDRKCLHCKRNEWYFDHFEVWTSDREYEGIIEDKE